MEILLVIWVKIQTNEIKMARIAEQNIEQPTDNEASASAKEQE